MLSRLNPQPEPPIGPPPAGAPPARAPCGQAVSGAASALANFDLSGWELYPSCEPCPMCLAAAYWARVDCVYYAATRYHAAAAGFDDARLYDELLDPRSRRTLPFVHIAAS